MDLEREDPDEHGAVTVEVPADLIRKATRFGSQTGWPLIVYSLPEYESEVCCQNHYEDEFLLWDGEYDVPTTWREYMALENLSEEELYDRFPRLDWDQIDLESPKDFFGLEIDGRAPVFSAVSLIEDAVPLPVVFACSELENVDLELELGGVELQVGTTGLGDEYANLVATSSLAVACFQWLLDQRNTKIRLSFGSP